MKSFFFKKILIFLFVFSLFMTMFSCQPISSTQDAKNFSNAMIKAFFIGDEAYNKFGISKSDKTVTPGTSNISNFSNSHFGSELNDYFTYTKIEFSNSEISYEDARYTVNGTLYCAVDSTFSSDHFEATIILYGSFEVTKDGKTQDVVFDAKYTLTFTVKDEDHDGVYDFNLSGSFLSYVNDFVVNDSSWSITFSGKWFTS